MEAYFVIIEGGLISLEGSVGWGTPIAWEGLVAIISLGPPLSLGPYHLRGALKLLLARDSVCLGAPLA